MPESSQSPPPLEPANEFNFTCSCLNVHIVGYIRPGTSIAEKSQLNESGPSSHSVYLSDRSEFLKQPAYVNWEEQDARPSRRKSTVPSDVEEEEDESPSGPAWRKCWICDTRVYESEAKRRTDDGVSDGWVTIDMRSGIVWGDALNDLLGSDDLLPYSTLRLDLPAQSSSFGRPPHSAPPPIYPKIDETLANSHFISPVADPFFLPPPFIPSHPHLRNTCNEAVDFLRDKHLRMEDEVRGFIAKKSKEMRDLEDKVRVEVEMLWKKYEEVPGVEGLERSRSRSVHREDSREKRRDTAAKFPTTASGASGVKSPGGDATPTKPKATPSTATDSAANPIVTSMQSHARAPPPGASSLLAASLSANSFHAPPPKVADKVDDSILSLSRTLDKRSDARAVAMSHVFSVLDDAMANQAHVKRRESLSRTKEQPKDAASGAEETVTANENGPETDSWAEEERKLLAATDVRVVDGQEVDGTPKAVQRKELSDAKGKRAVKFEEPTKEAEAGEGEDSEIRDEEDHDEYVFDFELDDSKKDEVEAEAGDASEPKERFISRSRNMVEANLSKTLAADAPSHRAAWRVIEQNSSIYHSLRRTSTDSIESDTEAAGADTPISKLAMSMPMNIALPRPTRAQSDLPQMQRKTSLTDREGILVPALIGVMRQRGIPSSNALGLSPSRPTREERGKKTGRSASVSRERNSGRDAVRSFAADPGAVFESMAEDVVAGGEADEEDEDGEGEGTLRESGFMPPHLLARRRESQEGGGDVGWRSLATS